MQLQVRHCSYSWVNFTQLSVLSAVDVMLCCGGAGVVLAAAFSSNTMLSLGRGRRR